MLRQTIIAGLVCLSTASPVKRADPSIPQYVLDHAPLVYLDKQEQFFPSDIGAQLTNTHPTRGDFTPINTGQLTLANLDSLNSQGGDDVFLTSNEGITALPSWFYGVKPASDGSTAGAIASVIITVSKPNNVLDAFYFYFYAYNKGNAPFGIPNFEFGNHVGDWEHNMIRYDGSSGKPLAIWYSQHALGQAFEFNVVQKDPSGNRPLVYAARGTHANYALPGPHSTIIPGLAFPGVTLADQTSAGPLWDPLRNAYFYAFNASSSDGTAFTPLPNPVPGTATQGQLAPPANWLNYQGRWGDPQLPDNAKGQVSLFGERKYSAGPTGPRDKRLGRATVCNNVQDGEKGPGQKGDACLVKKTLIGAK